MTEPFNWKQPDYVAVLQKRARRIAWLREDTTGKRWALLRLYYRDNPWDLINDFGCTVDPRNVERGLPAVVPFVLFPKQVEWCKWVVERWKSGDGLGGLTEKSRDAGMSWLSMALAISLGLTHQGFSAGFGSRKEEYVDKIGAPKSLFWKGREFLRLLPEELRPGYDPKRDAPHMRINLRATGSVITGEAGDNIGRGDRASIYFTDEEAFFERPDLIEASLSQTTNCRIRISTPHGMNNPFAQKRHEGKIPVFTFHWRDDPRKDDAWYAIQCDKLDPVTLAQEVDLSYTASVTSVLIPSAWVQAAIGAAGKLGLHVTGDKRRSLDVADEGVDKNASALRHGISITKLEQWSGKGDDIFGTVVRAFDLCDADGVDGFDYDADGLGAGVRGDARVINEQRKAAGKRQVEATPFRGSGAVFEPDKPIPVAVVEAGLDATERINKDFFANAKAQAWWSLRVRFQRTYRAVTAGSLDGYDPDDLVSLDAEGPDAQQLVMELSQPTYALSTIGKVVVNKAPDGTKSPNLADAVMIAFAPREVDWFTRIYGRGKG